MENKFLHSKSITVSLILISILTFCLNLFSSVIHRPMWSDGTYWAYEILRMDWFFYSNKRFISAFAQLPSYLYLKMFSTIDIDTYLNIFNISYGFILYFWFITSSIIIYRLSKNLNFLILNSFLFFSTVFFCQPFAVAISSECAAIGICFFWILFLSENIIVKYLFSFLTILFAIGYELMFLFNFLYAFYFYISFKKNYHRKLLWINLGIGILSCVFLYIQTLTEQSSHIQNIFISNLFEIPQGVRLIQIIILFFFIGMFITSEKIKKNIFILLMLFTIGAAFLMIVEKPHNIFFDGYLQRTWVIPMVLLYLVLFIQFSNRIDFNKIFLLILISFLCLAISEIKINFNWQTGQKNLNEYLAKMPSGCKYIEPYEANKLFQKYAHLEWVLPFHSVLMQNKLEVDKVIFTRRVKMKEMFDPCLNHSERIFNYKGVFDIQLREGERLKFLDSIFNPINNK